MTKIVDYIIDLFGLENDLNAWIFCLVAFIIVVNMSGLF